MTSLVCNSFDTQYKRIQTFKNHYLNMIRIILKNKSNLSFNQIMDYNEIELNTTELMNSIIEFTKDIKKNNLKSNNNLNNLNNLNAENIKIIYTLTSFLPFMILYYNQLNINNTSVISNDIANNITNNTPREYTYNNYDYNYDYDYQNLNSDTLKIPLD
jgi:hypothetical protein